MPDVVFLDRSGKPFSVPEDQVADFESRGFKREGFDSAVRRGVEAEQRNRAEDHLGAVDAFGRAGARVATAGLSDFLLDAEESNFLREEYSTADTLGTLTGFGLGLASSGLGTASLGKSALGGFAGVATKASTAAAAGIRSPVARLAAEGAIEGAMFEASQVVSDAALTDDPMTIESVASRIAVSSVLGGGVGGLLGGASNLAGKLKTSKALDMDPDVVTNQVRRVQADGLSALKNDDALRRAAATRAQAKADALKAKYAAPAEEVGSSTVKAKPGAGKGRTPAPEAVDAVRLYEEAVQEVAGEFKAAQESLEKARLKLDDLSIDTIANKPASAAKKVKAMDEYYSALEQIDSLTGSSLAPRFVELEDFQKLQAAADKGIKVDIPEAATPAGEILRNAYGASKVIRKVEKAGIMSRAKKAAADVVSGAVAGAVFGNPFAGGLVGVGGTVLRAALGSQKVRSAIADSVAQFVKGVSSKQARTSAVAFLSGLSLGEKKSGKDQDPVKARLSELREAMSGGSLDDRLDAQLADLTVHNPAVAFKVADSVKGRLSYYQQQAPKPPPETPFHTPRWEPPPEALEAWARVVMAGEQPLEAMQQMLSSNRVDPVMLQTIQALYPSLFEEYRVQFLEQFAENPRELPYERRLFLSQMFGADIEPTADPQFVAFMQQRYAATQQQQPQAGQITGTPKPPEPTKGQRLAMR